MNEIQKVNAIADEVNAMIVASGGIEAAREQADNYFFNLSVSVDKGNCDSMWHNYLVCRQVSRALGLPILPTTAFAVMGLDTDDVKDILAGKKYANDPDIRDLVRRVKALSIADLEQAHIRGDIQPSVLIWYEKNFAGMSDIPEPIKIEVSEYSGMTPQEIAEKYKDILA